MNSRREKIEAMLTSEPQDPFLRYSLALERQKEGEFDSALLLLKQLTEEQPPYVAAFFRAAQLLADRDRIDEARSFLRDGIEAAREQGDMHSAAEMSEMLTELGPLGETS
jgi:predicted Zn-dependent protease